MALPRPCLYLLAALVTLLAACGGDPAAVPPASMEAPGTAAGQQSALRANQPAGTHTVSGSIAGLSGAAATVILGNDILLLSTSVDKQGRFTFSGVPYGSYFIKAEARNFRISQSQTVLIGPVALPTLPYQNSVVPADSANVQFNAEPVSNNGAFTYHWEADHASVAGNEASASTVTPPVLTFLDQPAEPPTSSAAQRLLRDYNIVLGSEGGAWNQEQAARLLDTMLAIPQAVDNTKASALTPSKWILSDNFIADDVDVKRSAKGNTVVLSRAAFVYATPKLVLLNGVKGRYFSLRLHHAVVRYVTANGTDSAAVDRILQERFGVTVRVPDYAALTRMTTKEDAGRFAAFRPAELMSIISMFEEMPQGYHKVKGLRYLVRRGYGQPHPLSGNAAAMAWPRANADSYIEFMDSAFVEVHSTHRLIIHEKTHFMWANLFDEALRQDWATTGGWYVDHGVSSGWSTTQTTQFVSPYAHFKNPDEDLAESVADYVLNPALLRSRAPAKFDFIERRIMRGDMYVAAIRPDLTFQVYNLYPDTIYPGKIKTLDLSVTGAPNSDKLVKLDIELTATDPRFPGAVLGYMRLHSDSGSFIDVNVRPTDGTGRKLSGTFTISKYAKSGYWGPSQIELSDQALNRRVQGVRDFGWQLYIDNPLEATGKTGYVPGSLTLQLLPSTVVVGGHPVQKLQARWQVEGERSTGSVVVYASLASTERSLGFAYGTYDSNTRTALVEFDVTDFFPTGSYHIPFIAMIDDGRNITMRTFSNCPCDEAPSRVAVTTSKPDTSAPELDLNRISITAVPTNAQSPNGETLVKLVYYARDDKSGLGQVNLRLLDPQGTSHFYWHYHASFYTKFFVGDPTAWTRYEFQVLLPAGSMPGTWGLQTLQMTDKAFNVRAHDFVELLHFTVAK